jgi:hypothetical protein
LSALELGRTLINGGGKIPWQVSRATVENYTNHSDPALFLGSPLQVRQGVHFNVDISRMRPNLKFSPQARVKIKLYKIKSFKIKFL